MGDVCDATIISSNPTGLSAAVYAQRARLAILVLEKEMMSGEQVPNTYEVGNYPGLPGVNEYDMGIKFRSHADSLEAGFVTDEVIRIKADGAVRHIACENGAYEVKSIAIATGAAHRKLGIPGEEEPTGMGISYCVTCDGASFGKKVTVAVGGNNMALEDAIFLARACGKVCVLHRKDEFCNAEIPRERLMEQEDVEILWDTVIDETQDGGKISSLKIANKKTGVSSELPVGGVFVAVGITPNSQKFEGLLEMGYGHITAAEDCKTSVPGIFTAGNVRTKQFRQIITAVSDGANAIASVEWHLTEYQKGRRILESRNLWTTFRDFFRIRSLDNI